MAYARTKSSPHRPDIEMSENTRGTSSRLFAAKGPGHLSPYGRSGSGGERPAAPIAGGLVWVRLALLDEQRQARWFTKGLSGRTSRGAVASSGDESYRRPSGRPVPVDGGAREVGHRFSALTSG